MYTLKFKRFISLNKIRAYIGFFPASVFFSIFLIIPLIILLLLSIEPSDVTGYKGNYPWLSNYLYYFKSEYYRSIIIRTLRFATITTVLSVVIGYVAALILRRIASRFGNIAVLVLTFPIFSGSIVTVLGWMIMLTGGGIIGQSWNTMRIFFGLSETSSRLLGTDGAVIVGMVHFNLAFVILNILNVLLQIDPNLELAAMNLGAKSWRTFWRIVWPLSLPGIFSATLLSFAFGLNAFVSPTYLGNKSRLVMTTLVSQSMFTTHNWQFASTASIILLSISLLIILLQIRIFRASIKF
ncbi:MAG: hypothetical protein A2Y53_02135 [Chloroflexi bacterium RBG_16_47_49]|nr:MAG: hypothetical protein A2Y53_02135 [Chloroflexi bacterium RBG_16_47_49]